MRGTRETAQPLAQSCLIKSHVLLQTLDPSLQSLSVKCHSLVCPRLHECITKVLPRGVRDQVLGSLHSLLLSSCALSTVSQFNPWLYIRKQSSRVEVRAEHQCILPQCTAVSFTKPGHMEGRSKLLPFHASSRPGATRAQEKQRLLLS